MFCPAAVGCLILRKIPRPARGWSLSMGRTNWNYDKHHINILTVGILVNRIASSEVENGWNGLIGKATAMWCESRASLCSESFLPGLVHCQENYPPQRTPR